MKSRILSITLAAVLAVTFAAGALAQEKAPKLYKWVDKNGVVHYGSSVPPEYANQQLDILNSEGITVKTIEAHKTSTDTAEGKQAQAAAAEKAKQEQQQKATDQMLLDTYTSVADIERDRDSRLAGMNSQINVINGAIAGLQSTLAEYQGHETVLMRAHKPISADLKKSLDSTQQQLATDQKLLATQQQQKQVTQEQYAAYIKRFRQLTQNQGNNGGW
ncbi:MAG: DUF4124 domain-containing protein [Gammaproteobacteria bacterium]